VFPRAIRNASITLPRIRIPHILDTATEPISVSLPTLILGAASAGFCGWYVVKRHWLANNVLGIALSLEGIEFLNLGSVHVGVILLVGLFFYDIFWVFFTPVMVGAARGVCALRIAV
jgi:minor histocompatibility antigen H13